MMCKGTDTQNSANCKVKPLHGLPTGLASKNSVSVWFFGRFESRLQTLTNVFFLL